MADQLQLRIQAGIASLFPAFHKDTSIYERVKVTVKRHQYDYFKNWDQEKFAQEDIPVEWQPSVIPITEDMYTSNIKKNEYTRNKKLAYCMQMSAHQENEWAVAFRRQIREDVYTSITHVKDVASDLWRQHSGLYDGSRAVHVPSVSGRGHQTKKSRRVDETEGQYRRRIKQQRSEDPAEHENVVGAVHGQMLEISRIHRMKRQQLLQFLEDNNEQLEKLTTAGPVATRTTEELRVAAVMAAVVKAI